MKEMEMWVAKKIQEFDEFTAEIYAEAERNPDEQELILGHWAGVCEGENICNKDLATMWLAADALKDLPSILKEKAELEDKLTILRRKYTKILGVYAEEVLAHKETKEARSIVSETFLAELEEGNLIRVPSTGMGDLSDGYHTFNELYHHRAVLFSIVCNANPFAAWKSKLHDDGTMYDNMFIVGINTPKGQATYHYNIEPYWDMFHVKEFDRAPKWDGHSSADAVERLYHYGQFSAEWLSKIVFPTRKFRYDGTERPVAIAVDFDGCLATNKYPSIGAPNEALIRALKTFRASGGELILWTCREGTVLADAILWCKGQGLTFDAINDNLPRWKGFFSNNTRKVGADYYIDDKAICVEYTGKDVTL